MLSSLPSRCNTAAYISIKRGVRWRRHAMGTIFTERLWRTGKLGTQGARSIAAFHLLRSPKQNKKPEGTYTASRRNSLLCTLFSLSSAGFPGPLSGFRRLSLFAEMRHCLLSIAGFAVNIAVNVRWCIRGAPGLVFGRSPTFSTPFSPCLVVRLVLCFSDLYLWCCYIRCYLLRLLLLRSLLFSVLEEYGIIRLGSPGTWVIWSQLLFHDHQGALVEQLGFTEIALFLIEPS